MNTNEFTPEDFSLSEGGPFYNARVQMRLQNKLRTLAVTSRCIMGIALTRFMPFITILFIHFSVADLWQKISAFAGVKIYPEKQ